MEVGVCIFSTFRSLFQSTDCATLLFTLPAFILFTPICLCFPIWIVQPPDEYVLRSLYKPLLRNTIWSSLNLATQTNRSKSEGSESDWKTLAKDISTKITVILSQRKKNELQFRLEHSVRLVFQTKHFFSVLFICVSKWFSFVWNNRNNYEINEIEWHQAIQPAKQNGSTVSTANERNTHKWGDDKNFFIQNIAQWTI